MKYKFLLLIHFLLASSLYAQKTRVIEDDIRFYNSGLELLDKEKYGAAQEQFRIFINRNNDFLLEVNAEYYYALCALELFNPDAVMLFHRVAANYPEHPKAKLSLFQLGRHYFRQKEFKNAVQSLDSVEIDYLSDKEINEFYFMKGYSLFRLDRFEEAKKALHEVKEIKNQYYYPANYYYGYISYRNNELDDALTSFERVKDSKIYGPLIPLYIAQIYFAKGQYDKAISYGDTITGKEIVNDVRFVVGQAHYQLKNYGKALPYLEKYAESGKPMSDDDIYRLGYSYYASNQYEKAYMELQKIADDNDSLAQYANYTMADSYLKLGKKQNARNAFYNSSKLNFDNKIKEISTFNYAKLSSELAYQQVAIFALRDFINTYPRSEYNDDAKELLSQLMLNTKNYKEAIPILESIKIKNDNIKAAYQKVTYYRGEELYLNQDFAGATQMFTKSIQYNNDKRLYALSHYWIGETLYKSGKYSEAIEHFQVFTGYPEVKDTRFYSLAYYNLGYCYFQLEKWESALSAFKKMVEIESYYSKNGDAFLDANMRIADCYFVQKNYDKALDAYSYVINKNSPSGDYALYQKGIILGVQNKNNEKISILRQIPAKYPKSKQVDDALYEIAIVRLQEEDYDNAVREFRYIISDYPNSPYVKNSYLSIGLIYYNRKLDDQALVEFKKVIDLYPKTPEAREAFNAMKNIYLARGQSDIVIELIPNATASFKDSVTYEAAFNLYRDEKLPESVKGFNKYISEYPKGYFISQANFYKAEANYQLKKFDEALEGYEGVIQNPRSDYIARSYRQAANIHFFKKNFERALEYYKALEQFAESKDIMLVSYLGQMRSAHQVKKSDETFAASQKLLGFEKSTKEALIEAHLHVARVFHERNELDSALTHFRYVIKETKSAFAAESKYYVGLIQYQKKELAAAQKTMFELGENYSSYEYWVAKGFIVLADIYVEQKDNFQAKQTLKSIIDNYEGKDEIVGLAQEKLNSIQSSENQKKEEIKKQQQKEEETE